MLVSKYLNVFHRIVVAGALLLPGLTGFAQTSTHTLERLSLFVHDGVNAYEDRRLVSPVSHLPTGLTVQFTPTTIAAGQYQWVWVLHNTNATDLSNLRVTALLDADLSAEDNTFHNEHGELVALSAPAGHIAADKWEISELGYRHGDLLPRASRGALASQSDQAPVTADDTAMALSIPVGTLEADQILTVTATLSPGGTAGLKQEDAHDNTLYVFQAYAQKSPRAPQANQNSDYAVTKIAQTPSISVGATGIYTIEITNNGPDAGSGVTLTDAVSADFTSVTWTCAASGSASCGQSSGSGNAISVSGQVPVGDKLTITVSGTANNSGAMINTAAIAPSNSDTTDANSANDTASAVIAVLPAGGGGNNLAIDKRSTTPNVAVGATVRYQLAVTNRGAGAANGVIITDNVPADIGNVSWRCQGANGATCGTASGSGNAISVTANLPSNSAVTIDITGTANTAGVIDNTAAISGPGTGQSMARITARAGGAGMPLDIPTTPLGMVALMVLLLAALGAVMLRRGRKMLPTLCLMALAVGLSATSPEAKAIFLNGDFETGDFGQWTEGKGGNPGLSGSPPFQADNIRISNGGTRLLDISGHAFDPRAPQLSLPRQGNFSAKVNDEVGGAHTNFISQKDTITEADRDPVDGKLHVRFTYAAVLSDPGHSAHDQPYFHVLLKDLTDDDVLYDDFAYSNQPGRLFFTTQYSGIWRSTNFIDVDMVVPDSSLGHELEVRVLAADCSLGGHVGYVYVDAFGAHAIPPQGGCLNGLTARGKPGMVQLSWPDNGAAKYRVYRAPKLEGPYEPLGVTDSRYSTWLDRTVETGKTYYYNVRPIDTEGHEICTSGEVIGVAPDTWSPGDPLNRPPFFSSAPITSGDVRAPYVYNAIAIDADNDPLTYSLVYGPIGMTIDSATGRVDWQPTESGFYRVNIDVDDGNGHIANQAYAIEVTDSNRPPVINNPLPVRVPANVAFSHNLQATDPDGDQMVFAIGAQASGLTVTTGGVVSWPSPQPGRYPTTVVVADIHGAKTQQLVVLEVQAFPKFVSYPVIRGTVNTLYTYQARAEDTDSPVLRYSLAAAPAGMTVGASTGLIQWTPNATGTHVITVEATDPEGNVGRQTYTLQITATANRAPYFTGTPVVYVAYPSSYDYTAAATDADGDTMLWTLKQSPAGMTIVETSGRIRWSPTINTAGIFTVEVEVIDQRGGVATQLFDVQVPSSVNNPPQITSNPGTQIRAGATFSYSIRASDPDGEPLTYALKQSPAAMTLTDNLVSWVTTVADIGPHSIEIEVADPRGGTATQTWVLEVVPATVNRAPVISSTPAMVGTAGNTYTYQVAATDADGDPLAYTLENAPVDMTISATGKVEWAIPVGTAGSFDVEIKVADDKGAYTQQIYTIGVGGTGNRPPRITSQSVVTGTAGNTYAYQVYATDPDNDPLSYMLNQQPAGMTVSPSGRIEWAIPSGTTGTFDVEIEVSDGRGGIARQIYVIGVSDTGNRAPLISSQPPVTGTAGVAYAYQVVATDADGDTLTYTLLNHPAGMTISSAGKVEWAIPANLAGEVDVEIEVSDGRGGAAQQGYAISVAGSGNRAPRITSSPVTTANIGSLYVYDVRASDPDGDTLSYALTTNPTGMTISAAGRVEWTASAAQNGYHDVVLTVSDGRGGVAIQTYTVYAQLATNRPPRISSTPIYRGKPGVSYQYNVIATDPDGDALTYALTQGPAGMTMSATGLVSWSTPVNGNHDVVVTVSDPHGAYVSQSYVLKIGANTGPVINSIPVTTGMVGIAYRYEVQATDADGDFLTYQLTTKPTGMTVSGAGVIEWTPSSTGNFNVVVRVSDGQAWQDQGYSITVRAASSEAFSFTVQAAPQHVRVGDSVALQAFPEGGTPPYTVTSFRVNNANVTPDASYQAIFTPAALGKYTVRVTMRDGRNTSITQETVFWANDGSDITPPVAEITAPARSDDISVAEITTVTDIIGSAFDDNLAEYQLVISPVDKNQWTNIGGGTTSVSNAKLGTLNPQTMANGMYELGLVVTDSSGNQSSAKIGVVILGEQKIGQFALSFTDFDIEVGGLPLQLTRTYDTRRQFEKLDFGYGWSVDYQNVVVQTNGVAGRDWETAQIGSGLNVKYCPRPYGTRIATVRLPDGKMERFDIKTEPECNGAFNPSDFFSIRFEPRAGTYSTLESTDVGQLRVHGNALIDYGTTVQADPQQFKLTLKDGTIYYLDKQFGIRQIKDRHGNTLSYTRNGIVHSEGASLLFTRDAQDRITEVSAPDGRVRRYTYDAAGNLENAADPKSQSTHFTYHTSRAHQLDEIHGADGKRIFKAQFDNEGRLTTQTDGKNFSIGLTHNTASNKDIVKDRNGYSTTYVYDDDGNITEVTDALGGITRYTYDAFGNETSVTDALGNTTTREFDAYGNITKEINALGYSTETAYNAEGNPTTTTDELGRVTRNVYDNATGDLKQLIDAAGNSIDVGYSVKGDLASIADALGYTTRYGYTSIGSKRLKTSETDAAGNTSTFEYDTAGNETARKQIVTINGVATELTTRRTYDANGNVLSETDASGYTTTYQYDTLNQLIQETDAQGRITRYSYNERGEQTGITYPDGGTRTIEYDRNGNETRTCERGICTSTAYDALNRAVKTTDAASNVHQTDYDAIGNVTKETDARGFETLYEYDAGGRQTKQTDALGNETLSEYDAAGNLTKQIDGNGHATEYVHNERNQRTRTTLATGSVTEQGYDAAGRRTSDTDAEGHQTQFGYDALGQLTQVTDALNNVTGYGYDERGLLTRQTDAENRSIVFIHDKTGQRTGRILPGGEQENWNYDSVGNLIEHTAFNGDVTRHEYDDVGQIGKTYRADGSILTYTRNSYGYLTQVADTRYGNVAYSRDYIGRATRMTSPMGRLDYTWDGNSNKLTQSVYGGGVTRYTYDALNRVDSLTAPDGSQTQFEYDAAGNRTKITRANGAISEYRYNEANQLTGIEHRKADNSVLANFAYTLDRNGRRTQVVETINGQNRTIGYQYDATGKLLQEKAQEGIKLSTTDYVYDAVGNRLSKTVNGIVTTYQYNANDQLVSETTGSSTTRYEYDPNGNLARKETSSGDILYTWNTDNKLTGIDDRVNGFKVTYTYDAEGRRIGKTLEEGGTKTETQYLVDAERPYSEIVLERTRISGGAWQETTYLHTPDGVGELLSQVQGGQTIHLYQDGHGSTRLTTDDNQNIGEIHSFNAFGSKTGAFGQSASAQTDLKHLYVGEYFDQSSGFYHLRARDYDPATGRFAARDAFEGAATKPLSLNKYVYANSDPINLIDPSGHFGLMDVGISQNIQSSLMTLGGRVFYLMQLYDRVQAVVGFVQLIAGVHEIMGVVQGLSSADFGLNGSPTTIDYREAIESLTYNLPRAIGTGIGDWSIGYARTRQNSKVTGFLLYMPMFIPGNNNVKPISTGAKITFDRRKVPIKLVFGGPSGTSGQLFGLGMEMKGMRQLVRMDHHKPASGHGGANGIKANELAYWIDGSFHYHVNKWK